MSPLAAGPQCPLGWKDAEKGAAGMGQLCPSMLQSPKGCCGRRVGTKEATEVCHPCHSPPRALVEQPPLGQSQLCALRVRTGQCNQAMDLPAWKQERASPHFIPLCGGAYWLCWAWRSKRVPRGGIRERGSISPPNLCLGSQWVTLRTSAHQCPTAVMLPKPAGTKHVLSTVASCFARCHL